MVGGRGVRATSHGLPLPEGGRAVRCGHMQAEQDGVVTLSLVSGDSAALCAALHRCALAAGAGWLVSTVVLVESASVRVAGFSSDVPRSEEEFKTLKPS